MAIISSAEDSTLPLVHISAFEASARIDEESRTNRLMRFEFGSLARIYFRMTSGDKGPSGVKGLPIGGR